MILYLSKYQKIEITVITISTILLILLFRPIILGYNPDSKQIIVYGLLIFIWLGLSKIFTNLITNTHIKNQLNFNC